MYSFFGGVLKFFKLELKNLMVFGVDDKRCQWGGGGLNKIFDRVIYLFWKIYFCKNIDIKFVFMYIIGEQVDYNE